MIAASALINFAARATGISHSGIPGINVENSREFPNFREIPSGIYGNLIE